MIGGRSRQKNSFSVFFWDLRFDGGDARCVAVLSSYLYRPRSTNAYSTFLFLIFPFHSCCIPSPSSFPFWALLPLSSVAWNRMGGCLNRFPFSIFGVRGGILSDSQVSYILKMKRSWLCSALSFLTHARRLTVSFPLSSFLVIG